MSEPTSSPLFDEADLPEAAPLLDDQEPPEPPMKLTPGWIAVGVVAVAFGIAMGFIMSSAWLIR